MAFDEVLRSLDVFRVRSLGSARQADAARYIAQALALAAGYVLVDAASFFFHVGPVPVKPWNPQVGLAVALLCAGGLRHFPAVLAGAFAAEAWLRNPGAPLADQFACALAAALALAAIAYGLALRGLPRAITSVRAMRDFFVIVALGALVSAVAYVATAMLVHGSEPAVFWPSVGRKWLGDALGLIAATPLTLLLLAPGSLRFADLPRSTLWFDAIAFVGSLAIAVGVVFGPFDGERLFYLLFLPLIVIAMRRGLPGAAVGVAAAQIAILVALRLDGRSADDAAGYQMLMLVLGTTTLLLGAVAGERRRTQLALAQRSAELRAQQQALADAMRVAAASETASTLAHEMSQPLSAIGTYARAGIEMLRRGSGSVQDLDGVLERIVAESARTRETVQRIREFFRTGSMRREAVTVATLAADVQEAMRDRLDAQAIALTLDTPAELPAVDADRVQIGTVLHNLVGNAADALAACPPPRWIRLGARARGAFVEIEVADGGPGIDPAIRDALFEPLATTKPTGMGLGLPIARTLVHAHGGHLTLAHVHPTTFRFTLPIHGHDDP